MDLVEVKNHLKAYIPDEVAEYFLGARDEFHIQFPVNRYPKKPKSLNLKKQGVYQGKLTGIKGQYLIFEDDTVFNVRSNEGRIVRLTMC